MPSSPATRSTTSLASEVLPRSPIAEQTPLMPTIGSPRSMVRSYFGDNPWEHLNKAPTFYVIVSMMVCSISATYVLDQHILSTADHYGVFVVGCYVIFTSYFMFHYFLDKYSSSFKSISSEKKFYTISNLIKAGILMSITPFAVYELYQIVVHDHWNSNTLRNLGCIYAIPDFVSMIVVRRMAWTTIFHHVCVQIFNYFSVHNDYNEVNVCRLIVVYAAFSTFAYCVNMLLASRFLGVSQLATRMLSAAAFFVYVGCCAINWLWQASYIRRLVVEHNHWSIYVYMVLITFVMWDDIVLNKWLLSNMMRGGEQQHQKRGRTQQHSTINKVEKEEDAVDVDHGADAEVESHSSSSAMQKREDSLGAKLRKNLASSMTHAK